MARWSPLHLSPTGFRRCVSQFQFVPEHWSCTQSDVDKLSSFLFPAPPRRLLVITGAGVSTESGIPDYRSQGVGLYARPGASRPIQHQEFVTSASARQRYWARNYLAWPFFSSRAPNVTHEVLAELCDIGCVEHVVTQNVDGLHTRAVHMVRGGAWDAADTVTELHGCSHRVQCLRCARVTSRHQLQVQITEENPGWHHDVTSGAQIAPDGDIVITAEQVMGFTPPHCRVCASTAGEIGVLKPQVVFFGDNVLRRVVDGVYERVRRCDALLCAGTSLHVYSAYRFVREAHALGKPIAILNIGETRADKLATVRVTGRCGELFTAIREKYMAG